MINRLLTRGGASLLSIALLFLVGCGPDRSHLLTPVAGSQHSIIAVGDTGRSSVFNSLIEGQVSVARAMEAEAKREPIDDLIFLGDNFYWNGLDEETLVPRVAENLVAPYCYFLRLDGPRSKEVAEACNVPENERAPVPVYAVLGNHDLILPESPELQRNAVPDFVPDWRMSSGLTKVFELGDGISLILLESEVAIDDGPLIIREVEKAVRQARGPWRILATHRPIATDDHGHKRLGGFPGFVRDGIQASGLPVQLVLAGHHHSLQVFEVPSPIPSLQIGAGSGSRPAPPIASPEHPDVRFSRLALGFARIDLVGQNDSERLVVTLIQAPRYPVLSPFIEPQRVAQFEVDQAGEVLDRTLR